MILVVVEDEFVLSHLSSFSCVVLMFLVSILLPLSYSVTRHDLICFRSTTEARGEISFSERRYNKAQTFPTPLLLPLNVSTNAVHIPSNTPITIVDRFSATIQLFRKFRSVAGRSKNDRNPTSSPDAFGGENGVRRASSVRIDEEEEEVVERKNAVRIAEPSRCDSGSRLKNAIATDSDCRCLC